MADGGIGEAALISAAIGGGSAAMQGQDPIKGMLLGGALGGLGAYGAGQLGTAFGRDAASLAAGQQAATNFGQQAAGLGTSGIDFSGMIPVETGFYDPATMSNIAAPAVSTPQGLASQQITDLQNLSPIAKSSYLQAVSSGTEPTEVIKEAARANRMMAAPEKGLTGSIEKVADWVKDHPKMAGAALTGLATLAQRPSGVPGPEPYTGPMSFYKFDPRLYSSTPMPPAPYKLRAKEGGIMSLAGGGLPNPTGPVERMSQNVVGGGGLYPQSQFEKTYFATPTQMPTSAEVIRSDYEAKTNPYTGVMMAPGGIASSMKDVDEYVEKAQTTKGGMKDVMSKARADDAAALFALSRMRDKKSLEAQHNKALKSEGIMAVDLARGGDLGGYSDGGRMLRGPGDGMSDSIPGVIGNKRPARLADGEFVVPADVVSHLGNGSTEAGAKKLYSMMDRVRHARTGTKKQGRQINPNKFMPA